MVHSVPFCSFTDVWPACHRAVCGKYSWCHHGSWFLVVTKFQPNNTVMESFVNYFPHVTSPIHPHLLSVLLRGDVMSSWHFTTRRALKTFNSNRNVRETKQRRRKGLADLASQENYKVFELQMLVLNPVQHLNNKTRTDVSVSRPVPSYLIWFGVAELWESLHVLHVTVQTTCPRVQSVSVHSHSV